MITIAIQAGGRSSRMGQDKGLVRLAGKPLIEHILAKIEHLAEEILITTNHPQRYAYLKLPMAADEHPAAGALEGLRTALRAAKGDHVLVLACDMPFVQRPLLEHLLSLSSQADVIVPRWEDRFQTMHAVYARKTCLPAVEAALNSGQKRLISFYPQVHVLTLEASTIARFDPTGRSFFNINHPQDLELAEAMLRK